MDSLQDIEKQVQSHIKDDMERLERLIKLYEGMQGAYARKRAIELYETLGKTLATIEKTI